MLKILSLAIKQKLKCKLFHKNFNTKSNTVKIYENDASSSKSEIKTTEAIKSIQKPITENIIKFNNGITNVAIITAENSITIDAISPVARS